MSQFYDQASLVMIPSGYKNGKVYSQKPLSTDGELTFSRASSATRVGPDGLIQRVRTNVLLQSNSFDTTWITSNATVTSGQAGYDGTNNAWELNSSVSGGSLLQSNTQSGLQTFSVYAKGSVSTGIRLYAFGSVNAFAYFNLNTGAVGSASGGVTAQIQSVGGGWHRCSMSFDQTNTQVRFYTTDNNNTNAAGIVYIQNAQLETSDIATEPILTTSAAVSVGPVANVPRLDYLNSSCPRLLLEPQRSNVFLNSESASAQTQSGTVTIDSNSATSPSGYQDADQITADTSSYLRQTITTVLGQSFAFSVFLKNVNAITTSLFVRNTATATRFDITWAAGVPTLTNFGPTATAKAVDYGNGWYRIEIVAAAVETSTIFRIYPSVEATSASVLFWGAQVETNVSYPTSYIPTLAAAVTRGADVAKKTSIASLIGQTEGVLYAEVSFDDIGAGGSSGYVLFTDGTFNNAIAIGREPSSPNSKYLLYIKASGVSILNNTANNLQSGLVKMAVAYKSGDWAAYLNGSLVASGSTTFAFNASMTQFGIGPNTGAIGTTVTTMRAAQALLFKTRLSNADLATLTTI